MFEFNANTFINLLFVIGLGQTTWFSSMLVRRGIAPATLWQASSPLLAIWILMWPVYSVTAWLWWPIGVLCAALLLIYNLQHPYCLAMRLIWGAPIPWSFLSLTASIIMAILFFQAIPEFGFALGLVACIAFPMGDLLDRLPNFKLGFPLHPQQTLMGHLALIFTSTLLCSWSIHLYHGINWQQLMIATLIAGMAASLIRAMLPRYWNLPIAILTMGWVLWLL